MKLGFARMVTGLISEQGVRSKEQGAKKMMLVEVCDLNLRKPKNHFQAQNI
jgi:hypothetical protein